jgi:tetratricopeptide (TPR) repeat protein
MWLNCRLVPLLLVLFCSVTPDSFLVGQSSDTNGEEILSRGQQLAADGQTDEALLAFDRFKQRHPRDFRPFLYSGLTMLEAGRPKDAILELDEAANRNPEGNEHILAYSQAKSELGRFGDAIQLLSEFEDSSDLDPEALWLLADLYYRQKKHQEGLRILDKYAARKPDDPRTQLRRGQFLILAEKFEDALTALEEAKWANPFNPVIHFDMASTLVYGNNFEAAKKVISDAVVLDPGNPEYLHLQGIIHEKLSEHEEAIRSLELASQSPEAFSRIYFDLGNALRNAGQVEESRKVLKRYREIYRAEQSDRNRALKVQALINQGQLQISGGKVSEARSSFLRALDEDPSNFWAHNMLAKIYMSSGTPFLARRHLDEIQQLDPETSEGNFLEAFYWYSDSNYAEALRFAEKSKALRPGDAELRNLLGNIHFRMGRSAEALREYEAAMRLAPERDAFKANYKSLAGKVSSNQ